MRCVDCDNEAEFTSPKRWCSYHWNAWWVAGVHRDETLTPQQYEDLIQEYMKGDPEEPK